jgi:hypothetical protein
VNRTAEVADEGTRNRDRRRERRTAVMNERRYDDAFELLSDDLEWWLAGDESKGTRR